MTTKKAIHSVRIAYENWFYPARFSDLMSLLKKYPNCFHQLALFTSATHAPLTLKETEIRVEIMRERIERIKEKGFTAGINILATIGHHEEDLKYSLQGPYTHMTGYDGKICKGSYCMNDTRFLEEYVRPVYQMLARANPDFIWIDDDVRLGHWPIGNGCFCDGCIKKFNKRNNTSFSRETLVEALNSNNLEIRKAWLSHNTDAISGLFRTIAKTVREINPNIQLGFMTGERYMEGYAFAEFADVLSEHGKYPIMWRPGGGCYSDYIFDEFFYKAETIGRQNAYLPPYVTSIQSEIENFPYQLIKKTPTSTMFEAFWYMTCGSTSATFNIFPSESNEPIATVEPHLRAIEKAAEFSSLLAEKTAGKQPIGIHTGWRPDSQLALPAGSFINGDAVMYANFAHELFDFGLPQCYRPENAVVTLLTGQNTLAWSKKEIISVLSKGVYANASALTHLNDCGFNELTGFKVDKKIPLDAREVYTDHPINDGIKDGIRNCRQAFHPGDSFGLSMTSPNAISLAKIEDYHGNTLADCCIGLYENKNGGRICIGGYYPFSWLSDYPKSTQLKRLMVYLSDNTLPSYVESYHRIRNHTFIDGRHIVVALCNPSNEHLTDIRVAVRTNAKNAICYHQNCSSYSIHYDKLTKGDSYHVFCIDALAPYEMALLEI